SGGRIARIVEQADVTPDEREIREVNAGIYVFDIAMIRLLIPSVQTHTKQKEYSLPDVIELALKERGLVLPVKAAAEEVLGINTRAELALAEKIMRRRINHQWMTRGVTMRDPDTTYIDADVELGTDVVLYPNIF